jgi:recombination DNA repair RAD52 pathway protein
MLQLVFTVADYIDCNRDKYSVGVVAFVKVELKNGIQHQDVGYGICNDSRSKGYAIAHARKVSEMSQQTGVLQKQLWQSQKSGWLHNVVFLPICYL